jgi:cytochrome b subunit of formate dehydrogenase
MPAYNEEQSRYRNLTYAGSSFKRRFPTDMGAQLGCAVGKAYSLILLFLMFALMPLSLVAQTRVPHLPDQPCLACHGQPGFTSSDGKSISINPVKRTASVHGIVGCKDCHSTIKGYPHAAKVAKVQCSTCHAEETSHLSRSVHSSLGEAACQSCHGNVHEISGTQTALTKCGQCHDAEMKEFRQSVHGAAAAAGDPDAPQCFSCHGSAHQIRSSSDGTSPVSKKNMPDTCAACHSNQQFLSRHKIPFAPPVELYRQSVHGRALANGDRSAATCSDCHGSHRILPGRDPRSTINHWNIAKTCGQCHAQIASTYLASVHGQAMKAGSFDAPVCTDCHGEHLILGPREAVSPVSAARISTVTCGRCHNDERLAIRYNLPMDRVPSYADSYHGLAMREGSLTVANCASCHGAHNILPPSDPRSAVNAANLPKTCGGCHAGAGEHFAIGPVHVQTGTGPTHPVVKAVRWFYWLVIPLTLGFMVLHNLVDFTSKLIRRIHPSDARPMIVRMSQSFLIFHWGLILSFAVLVVTGFALKYPGAVWAQPLLLWEGQFAFRGALHRAAAVLLLATMAYHIVCLAINRGEHKFLVAMRPMPIDATNLVQVFGYNLGLSNHEPQFLRFNYAEKLEYWALIWGVMVMAASGGLLWFNNFTLRHFPKWVTDAATAVHFYEAVLATFSILLWHFYMVMFDPSVYPMDTSWLSGKASADHFRHSRPEYLRSLGKEQTTDTPAVDLALKVKDPSAPDRSRDNLSDISAAKD